MRMSLIRRLTSSIYTLHSIYISRHFRIYSKIERERICVCDGDGDGTKRSTFLWKFYFKIYVWHFVYLYSHSLSSFLSLFISFSSCFFSCDMLLMLSFQHLNKQNNNDNRLRRRRHNTHHITYTTGQWICMWILSKYDESTFVVWNLFASAQYVHIEIFISIGC